MRTVTNVLMFLVALLTVVGIYVLREQSLGGLKRSFGALLGNQRPLAKRPSLPKVSPAKSVRERNGERQNTVPQIEVTMTAIPVDPKPTVDTIRVGMAKSKSWGQPDAVTSSREGEQFLETFIYLLEDLSKATVVRLVNGSVVSVYGTRTASPPLLVPQTKELGKSVPPKPDVM